MVELYTWPQAVRLLITFVLTLCVVAQTLALVLSYYRHPHSRARIFENLLEAGVLAQIFVCTLLHGKMVLGYELGLIVPTGYTALRYGVFVVTATLTAIVVAFNKKPWPLSVLIASGLTLPVVESILGSAFAPFYMAVVFFWLLRGVHICVLRTRKLRTSLSVLSIKNAIDTLHAGVLFGETDGFILLSNRRMQRLMAALCGRVRRDGWVFYGQLCAGKLRPGCRTAELEGQIVCLLPDESAWMFTKTDLNIKGRTYVQLTASDVTQRWVLTARLQHQEKLLKQRGDELNDTLSNIHILSRQRETQKAKMRAHDILGQRLTLLLRTMRGEQTPGYETLQTLSQGLMEDLKAEQNRPSVKDELEGLQRAFASIGVAVDICGALPGDETTGRLFVDIIRESVTNAVRHGFATRIFAEIESNRETTLKITNNGSPPRGPIAEGGGIGGMRKKVEPHGGTLEIAAHPQFVLTVRLPGRVLHD